LQNDSFLPSLLVADSNEAEAQMVGADDGVKMSVDVSSEASCESDVTVTGGELSVARPGDVDASSVLPAKPVEQSAAAASAARTTDAAEMGTSELSSQESSVTRTRSRGGMDFEHLRKKLVELTGPNKEPAPAAHSTTTGKTKQDIDELKDVSVDAVGAVPSPAPNSALQVTVGRAVITGHHVQLDVNAAQAVDGHRGPSVTPEPGSGQLTSAPVQAASQQQASLCEPPRDTAAVGQTRLVASDDEHAATPVQPVKPVPLYPVTGAVGQVNGGTAVPLMPAGVFDTHTAAVLQQQQQHVSSALDSGGGFVPVLPSAVGDVSGPASPDSIVGQLTAAQLPQHAPVDYSQASLLALYNQMMVPLPLVSPAWPALGLNPLLVAANPLLTAEMMYGAPLMPLVSELLGQMPASDAQLGVTGYTMAPQQPTVPGLVHADQAAVRAAVGPVPSSGTCSVMPVGAATRHVAPRPPPVPGHCELPAGQAAAGVQRKRPDRPPHLANLEQALIEKLHGPRKPVPAVMPGHSPVVGQSLPGTVAWFPQHALQSPVISPSFTADLQPQPAAASAGGFTTDMMTLAASTSTTLPAMSLTVGTFTYSGRTTPSVAAAAEYVTGKSVAAAAVPSAQKLTSNSYEASVALDVDSAGQMPSKHELQLTVSAVKDDPLAAVHLQESTVVCEALIVSSESSSQNPREVIATTQTCAAVTSASKAPVKKGRFRITDVKEAVSSSQLETSSQSPMTDPSGGCCETTAALMMAPELAVHQVR